MPEKSVLDAKREEKIKEQILDEAFKKAEVSRGLSPPGDSVPKRKSYKKPFPKLGILLIVLAILGLIFINTIPWAYIRYDAGYGQIDASFYKDFKNGDSEHQEIRDLFGSPYYVGLSINDFTELPASAFYGFISLIVLGVAITVFGIVDKIRDIPVKAFTIIHFIFAAAAVVSGIFLVLSVIKFLGAHFLIYYNYNIPLVSIFNFIVFPVAFIVVALGSITIKMMFTIMRMDFNELQKLTETKVSEQPFTYAYGGRL